jgi:ribosomal protein S18 acetylase RimI-like enzyme
MQIKSLAQTDFGTIYQAFNQAFADYEMQLSSIQLQTMLKRRGFNPDLSFAAFEGNDIVSFTFNGIGNFNGLPTAYDTGTGTLKLHRGKGLATQIFEYSIPYLREAGIRQYLLEVLQHNTKAVSVYRNLGFETTREFNYFVQKNEEICTEPCFN